MRKFYDRALGALVIFLSILFSSGALFSQVVAVPIQMPECTNDVPGYQIDLSTYPDMAFTTPEVLRQATCCGDGDRYLAFYVTLNPNVAAIEIVVAPSYADPGGSGNYQIVTGGDLVTAGICGPQIDAGHPLCITGAGPHKILYSKPGGNLVKYIFRQIPKPTYPASQSTRLNCTLPLPIYGLNNVTISATSKSANCMASLAACNTYLSCLNCDDPIFSGGANDHPTLQDYPYSITYTITGNQQASTLCGTYAQTGTFTVTVYDALTVQVTPNPAAFCAGGSGVTLAAIPSGGLPPYTYLWTDGDGNAISSSSSYNASVAGSYTATITDQLITATCSGESETRFVNVGSLPTISAGIDTTVCASSPVAILNGTSSTGAGVWTGGAGAFSPSANSLLATYTPTAGEISDGFVTLTLTSSQSDPGCSNSTSQKTINFSPLISANPAAGTISCYNGTTVINAAQSGGTAPYTYLWSNGNTGSSITASSGTYSLTVTDQFGCTDNTPITISQPSPLGINLTSTLDNGICDGTATAVVSGGSTPYTYSWTPSSLSTATITGQCAGDYTVIVSDNKGCSISQSVVINNDPTCQSLDITIPTHTDVDCYGGSNGSATSSVIGGTPGYSYLWTPGGSVSPNPIDLVSGTYTVMVTDFNGCKDYAAVSILQPTAITNTMMHTDVTSIGGTDGTATANPQGGNPGYNYTWSPGGQTTQTATNLSSGSGGVIYHVDITDSKSCTIADSVLINQPPCNEFLLSVNTSNVSCSGFSNGSAYIVIANGSGSYNISWSNGVNNVTSVTGLSAGTYTVTVTDLSTYCTTFQSFSITQPSPLSLGLVPTNISCNNDANGSIDLAVSGGTYPFSFSWVVGGKVIANHEDLVDIGPGTYTISVTDVNGCSAVSSIGITQPATLSSTYTYTNNPCYGNSLGSVDVTPAGGTTPYNYSWTGPSGYTAATQDISGLSTGGYLLTITDNNGCIHKKTVNINQPDSLTSSVIQIQQVSCAGGNDGDANLSIAGGTAPYTYAWTGPSYSGSSQNLLNVAAGTYNVTVTDANFCTETTSVVITTVMDETDPVIICPGNQTANASSTACSYTHNGSSWNANATDNCTLNSMTWSLTGATSGSGSTTLNGVIFNKGVTNVRWFATDGLGNQDSCEYTITITDVTNPSIVSCGGSTQSVNVDAGECYYTQSETAWDASATDNCGVVSLTAKLTGATIGSGLTSLNGIVFNKGITIVVWTATDAGGLKDSCSFTITVIDEQNPGIANCPSDISVGVDTGDCGAVVSWSLPIFSDNCSFTYTASHEPGDFFEVGTTVVTYTVTDGSGNVSVCSFDVTVDDNELPTISCEANIASCDPLITYAAPVFADNCSVQTVIQTGGLQSGTNYPVGTTTNIFEVTDIHNNTATCSFTVTIYSLPNATITHTDVTCNGNANGSIDLTISNGTSPFNYDWDNGVNTEDLSGLSPGTYTVQVFDNFGCTTSATATITQPAVITLTAEENNVNCFNGDDGGIDITISGGTTPYSYNWSNGATSQDVTGLSDGSYTVTVTDYYGCTITYGTLIEEPDTLVIQTSIYNATCEAPNGSIQAQISGGTTPYVTSWSNGSNTPNLNNVSAGTYSLSVIDGLGCTALFTGSVEAVSNLSANSIVRDVRCFGQTNGEIQVIMESGNAPFAYDWSNGASTALNDSLASGSYFVTVTDAFGCEVDMNVDVTQPDSMSVTMTTSSFISGTNVSVNGASDGWITTSVVGGTPAYTYEWSNGETSEDIGNLSAGAYSVVVIDQNGCKASAAVRFTEPLPLEMPEGFSPNGDGTNDEFVIHGIESYLDNDLHVFNRWGNVVYEKTGYQNEWFGDNTSGEPLPEGTYFAILKVYTSDDRIITIKGYVDLRR